MRSPNPLIVLTREAHDNVTLAAQLKQYGIGTLSLPSIKTALLPLSAKNNHVLKNLERYDRILFTSKKAKAFFLQELKRRKIATPQKKMISAAGSRDIARALPQVKGLRILYPRSAIGSSRIVHGLRRRGAQVGIINLYTTLPAPISKAKLAPVLKGKAAAIVFASPSAVDGFLRNIPRGKRLAIRRVPAVCIGSTTAGAARAAKFARVYSTTEPTASAMSRLLRKLV